MENVCSLQFISKVVVKELKGGNYEVVMRGCEHATDPFSDSSLSYKGLLRKLRGIDLGGLLSRLGLVTALSEILRALSFKGLVQRFISRMSVTDSAS